jgi:hypothetical protein
MAVIGSPPEFGSSGSWPPITSAPVEVAHWDLDQTVGAFVDPRLSDGIELMSRFLDSKGATYARAALLNYEEKEWCAKAENKIRSLAHEDSGIDPFQALFWKTQAVYELCWERDDPPTQLAPGGSDERSVSLRVGLTEERAREVMRSLGLSVGYQPYASLSGQLTSKTTTKITVAREEVVTRKITLTNATEDKYRLFALWHLLNRLSIIGMSAEQKSSNLLLSSTDFILSDHVVVTSVDVSRRQ